jgi:hypothetical protein
MLGLPSSSYLLGVTLSPTLAQGMNHMNGLSNPNQNMTNPNPSMPLISQHQMAKNQTSQPMITPSKGSRPSTSNPTSQITSLNTSSQQPLIYPKPPQNTLASNQSATNQYNVTFQAAYQQAFQKIQAQAQA